MTELRRSPLHDRHVDLGAKLADFGGWEMPIEYSASGGGVIAEHTSVREAVGIFDVSHLGKATVAGPGAREFVNSCLTADLGKIAPGQAQYTLCCAEDGGVIDDVFSYLLSDDEVFLMPNAANAATVIGLLSEHAPAGVQVTDQHESFAVIAVQGPKSAGVLDALGLPTELDYVSFLDAEFDGHPVRVCRTGYTGEHGYELIPAWSDAVRLWDALHETVRLCGGMPAGLGARDTLRTEMGYPLHGQDLTREISPVQAGSSWAVGWKKDAFWGRDALLAERAAGPSRKLRGLLLDDRGVPRGHMAVLDQAGQPIGQTTSGTFSPSLKRGIALALIDTGADLGDGSGVQIDVRGRRLSATLAPLPFVPSHVR
ncbi:MAG TPA: glycine cleavage system aminomethyltransferase GcvT [Jatrophihabitans sp.]|nr:glycine cleavage system aminomethyltransferase GcvT [Jatrophihabitans sp.]